MAVAAMGPALPAPAAPVTVSDAAIAADAGRTTIRLAIDGPVTTETFVLDTPPRVVVDLPEVRWRMPPVAATGLVAGLRYGLATPDRARLVVDLAGPALARRVAAETTADGQTTLVIELVPVAADAFRAVAGWPEGTGPQVPRPQGRPVVAIDPGHGGHDPGAVVGGMLEKDVTLRFSLALADALRRAGLEPVLTRDDDRFVSIAERVATAREAGAAVFLSIHADTVREAWVSGASVYTLGRAPSDRLAAGLARQAEASEALALGTEEAGRDVTEALFGLIRRETEAGAARLGPALVAGLAAEVPVLRSNPLRAAAFRVLKAPDVPSALIELGFMSSAEDRRRLADPDWQAAAVRGIVAALEDWFDGPRTAACAAGACILAE